MITGTPNDVTRKIIEYLGGRTFLRNPYSHIAYRAKTLWLDYGHAGLGETCAIEFRPDTNGAYTVTTKRRQHTPGGLGRYSNAEQRKVVPAELLRRTLAEMTGMKWFAE
jgi:hypothetical protein